jgi:hypothetical protein
MVGVVGFLKTLSQGNILSIEIGSGCGIRVIVASMDNIATQLVVSCHRVPPVNSRARIGAIFIVEFSENSVDENWKF